MINLLIIQHINNLNLGKKNWVEGNDDARGTFNTISQIKFKTLMLKSSLCECSDPYIPVKGTI